jgi:hypothetical protein
MRSAGSHRRLERMIERNALCGHRGAPPDRLFQRRIEVLEARRASEELA